MDIYNTFNINEIDEIFKEAIKNAKDIIFFIAEDGRIIEANNKAVESYGYAYDELIDMYIWELRSPNTLNRAAEQFYNAIIEGIIFETIHYRKDGSCFPIEVNSVCIGEKNIIMSIIRDITERANKEKELKEKYEELTAIYEELSSVKEELRQNYKELETLTKEADIANKAKGQFLATMSHEIRTPMNEIICIMELLSGTELNEIQREYVNMISTSSKSLLEIMDNLLDDSKIESDKFELNKEYFDTEEFSINNSIMNSNFKDDKLIAGINYSINTATILVVDDNMINRKVASAFILKKGYNCLCASNGKEAIEILDKENIDLILMDIQMPELNGLEATKVIREKEENIQKHIPIIAMTAYAMVEDKQKCIDAGMDDYMSKPIDANQIYRKIENYLGR